MPSTFQTTPKPETVAIGGVGGSGTRLIAELFLRMGCYLGPDRNAADDNLWFTLLFRHSGVNPFDGSAEELNLAVELFVAAMANPGAMTRGQLMWLESLGARECGGRDPGWIRSRIDRIRSAGDSGPCEVGKWWGWKEPNTHVFIEAFMRRLPNLQYIHVVRNGCDMAYSANRNQLARWGGYFLRGPHDLTPRSALRYWCAVHRRMVCLRDANPERVLLVNYDELCGAPGEGIRRILERTGTSIGGDGLESLVESVRPPSSIGRHRKFGWRDLDPDDVNYVGSLGFDVA